MKRRQRDNETNLKWLSRQQKVMEQQQYHEGLRIADVASEDTTSKEVTGDEMTSSDTINHVVTSEETGLAAWELQGIAQATKPITQTCKSLLHNIDKTSIRQRKKHATYGEPSSMQRRTIDRERCRLAIMYLRYTYPTW